jgi:hypothetical protein
MAMTEQEAYAAMTEAGRALIAAHPEIDEIKVVFKNSEGGLLHSFWIYSAKRQFEIDQATEQHRREMAAAAALRRARGEPEPDPRSWLDDDIEP